MAFALAAYLWTKAFCHIIEKAFATEAAYIEVVLVYSLQGPPSSFAASTAGIAAAMDYDTETVAGQVACNFS